MVDFAVINALATDPAANWYESLPLTDLTTMAQNVAGQVGPVMVGIVVIVAGFGLVKRLIKKAAG